MVSSSIRCLVRRKSSRLIEQGRTGIIREHFGALFEQIAGPE
jgi:hypothetical protein